MTFIFFSINIAFLIICHNGGNMARKGLRITSLPKYDEIDAGDDLCIPLMPFWVYWLL